MNMDGLFERLNAFLDAILGIEGILDAVTAAASALLERFPQ